MDRTEGAKPKCRVAALFQARVGGKPRVANRRGVISSGGEFFPPRYAGTALLGRHNARDTPLTRAHAGGCGRRGRKLRCAAQAHVLLRTDSTFSRLRRELCEAGGRPVAAHI